MKFGFIAITLMILLVLSVSVFAYDNYNNKKEVKLASIFGCMPVDYKYTDQEWRAKEQFYKEIFGYVPVRCDGLD